MQTVADRIQSRLAASDSKQADIVRVTGASKGTVSKWLSGTNTPKGSYLIALAKFLDVDSEWLLTGIEKEKETSTSDDTSEVLGWDDSTPLDDDEFEISHYDKVLVTAGNKEGEIQEMTDKKIRMSKRSARKAGASITQSFSYINDGDSMSDRISDGARCTADASKKEIKDGKIYCFRHGVMRRTKYLYWRPDGGLLIRSHNPEYEDEIVPPEQMDDIEILGWVWEWSNMERW
tara:strand:+ start:44863 stop:45561 length:699 start_codon:yes stop_codon:yes gene_type:complete